MSTPKRNQWISGSLLICSVVSLLLFVQSRSFPPPGIDGLALQAALNGGHSTLPLHEMIAGGAFARSHFRGMLPSLLPALLVLTSVLAIWNFGLWRRKTER